TSQLHRGYTTATHLHNSYTTSTQQLRHIYTTATPSYTASTPQLHNGKQPPRMHNGYA
ncbi:hypothetical protein Bpfe_002935, partial [Biomphalaria pfeifferi]